MSATISNPNERLMKFLQSTPEQQAAIDRIFNGQVEMPARRPSSGPLLIGMKAAAELLGVSRVTLWRILKAGKLPRVEILPGSARLRRADVEALVDGKAAAQ